MLQSTSCSLILFALVDSRVKQINRIALIGNAQYHKAALAKYNLCVAVWTICQVQQTQKY